MQRSGDVFIVYKMSKELFSKLAILAQQVFGSNHCRFWSGGAGELALVAPLFIN